MTMITTNVAETVDDQNGLAICSLNARVDELQAMLNAMVKERTQLDMTIRELARKIDGRSRRVRRVESAMR
jgi:hypothetical protein